MRDRGMSRRWQIQNKQAMKCGISFKTPLQDVGEICALSTAFSQSLVLPYAVHAQLRCLQQAGKYKKAQKRDFKFK